LELEEQQSRFDRRPPLLDLLQQRAAGGVGRIDGKAQHSVGTRPADQVVDERKLAHRLGEGPAIELGPPARVALGKRLRAGQRLLQTPLYSRLAIAVEERLEIPGRLRQLLVGGLLRARLLRGGGHRSGSLLRRILVLTSPAPRSRSARSLRSCPANDRTAA